MEDSRKPIGRFPFAIWFSLAVLGLLMVAWAMQAYSLLDWESAVALGIQNERLAGDAAERAWALESWGVAAADMLWPLPITVVAIIGIMQRRFYGFVAGMMAYSIGVYFPLFFAFQRWSTYPGTVITALVLFWAPSLLAILSLWTSRDEFQR
jgi:hypothetical protein